LKTIINLKPRQLRQRNWNIGDDSLGKAFDYNGDAEIRRGLRFFWLIFLVIKHKSKKWRGIQFGRGHWLQLTKKLPSHSPLQPECWISKNFTSQSFKVSCVANFWVAICKSSFD
jgi:hypothetical protein